jgi:hypothetical protein
MNTETTLPTGQPPAAAPNPKPSIRPKYRRNGNVARCPKALRDKINVMIQDGLSYRAIISALGPQAMPLTPSTLSRWKKGGYQDWLAEQVFIARTRARQETPSDLVREFDGTDANHAALQLGTLYIFEALRDLGPGSLNEKLGGDCGAFARLLNALARASRETMLLQKYRDACARARAMLDNLKDPKRKLTEDERRHIVLQVGDILGVDDQLHAPVPGAIQSPALGIITIPSQPATTPTSPPIGEAQSAPADHAIASDSISPLSPIIPIPPVPPSATTPPPNS